MKIDLTHHAVARCSQRGFKKNDFDLVAEYGTPTSGGILLTGKDIMAFEQEFKKKLHRLQKLKDVFVATTNDGSNMAKTVFRATKKQRRKQVYSW